ncbi:MAG TPA: response regulator, partial [Roseiflexaceae bacterium]|nr:response regulator [Roseiflexaceae bacterium]
MSMINILVVEDDTAIAEMLGDMLLDMGYGVCGVAHTGQDAITLAREAQPDLILMDIQLRGAMDGIEAASQIGEYQPTPLMFLTAYSDATTIARARATSPYGYLVKPFDEGALRAAIETTIHRARADARRAATIRQLAATLTSMGDAVVTTNVEGRITFFNPVAATLTGWEVPEVIGKYVDGVVQLRDESGNLPEIHPVVQVLRTGDMTSIGPHGR